MIRGRCVQAVDIGEQYERVSLDHLSDQGGQAIVVAEAQLAGGHRVVLVEDRDDAEAEEAGQRRAHVRVVVASHDVVRGEQNLCGVQVVGLEGCGPASHEQPLAHRCRCLHARQVLGLGGKAEGIQTGGHGPRGHDNDLTVAPAPAGHESRDGIDSIQVKTAILAGERG